MADTHTLSIIPLPTRLERKGGEFVLAPETVIVADALNQSNATYLRNLLAPPTGFALPSQADGRQVNAIHLAT